MASSGPLLITSCINIMVDAGISTTSNVHVLTHSMGCYVLQNALTSCAKPNELIGQLMMTEADVLKSAFKRKLKGNW
eukprot:scaffold48121_cov47-Attheya_sp.AAC.1